MDKNIIGIDIIKEALNDINNNKKKENQNNKKIKIYYY